MAVTSHRRQQLLQQVHVDVDRVGLGTLRSQGLLIGGQQRVDVAADGWGVILHVGKACGHGRGPGAVGQAHPQVEHDLGETTRSDIHSQTFHYVTMLLKLNRDATMILSGAKDIT